MRYVGGQIVNICSIKSGGSKTHTNDRSEPDDAQLNETGSDSEQNDGGMSYSQFKNIVPEEKIKLQSRVRQWAHRCRLY